MPTATQKSSEQEINQLNAQIRSQPWYQEWFRARGLDPNMVKLNEQQRNELTLLLRQNGYQLGDRMKVDEAGNINQKGGWAGMPTWAKTAIGGGVTAASMGLIPGVPGLGGLFGGGAQGGSTLGGINLAQPSTTGLFGVGAPTSAGIGGINLGGATLGGAASSGIGGINLAMPSLGTAFSTGGGVASGLGKAGDFISKLVGDKGQTLADAGSIFERFANDEANKRTSDFYMQDRYNQDALAAQQDRRLQEADAMKKIQQAGYIKSGGTPYDAGSVKLAGGRELPSFSFPRAPITQEAKDAAGILEQQMLNRVKPEGSFTPKPVEDFQRRGVGEQIGRIGGLATTGLNVGKTIWDLFR